MHVHYLQIIFLNGALQSIKKYIVWRVEISFRLVILHKLIKFLFLLNNHKRDSYYIARNNNSLAVWTITIPTQITLHFFPVSL